MRMIKKLFAESLCIMLLMGLVACGNAGGQNDTSAENAVSIEEQEEQTTSDSKEETDISAETSNLETSDSETSNLETPDSETSNLEISDSETGVNILVAYFSRTGNTKPLAEYAAEYYGADIYEILAEEPYTDEDIDYTDSDSRTTIEQNDESVRPAIDGSVENMDQYDVIVLAYPIWWGQAPRIIDSFLESYDFSGKTIIPFCTSASSDIGSSDDELYDLVSDSVTWIQGKRFAAGTSYEEVSAWLGEVYPADAAGQEDSDEESAMKLYFNDTEIPVTWESNETVEALMATACEGDIVVDMSMYGGWEQVGSLGKSYPRNDTQMTTKNGDIVLYSGNQIVVFYGENSWAYTKLGEMDLPEDEVTELLSNGDITLTLRK